MTPRERPKLQLGFPRSKEIPKHQSSAGAPSEQQTRNVSSTLMGCPAWEGHPLDLSNAPMSPRSCKVLSSSPGSLHPTAGKKWGVCSAPVCQQESQHTPWYPSPWFVLWVFLTIFYLPVGLTTGSSQWLHCKLRTRCFASYFKGNSFHPKSNVECLLWHPSPHPSADPTQRTVPRQQNFQHDAQPLCNRQQFITL